MLKIGALFSGIGSVDEALLKFDLKAKVAYTIENNPTAKVAYQKVYNSNNEVKTFNDITKVDVKELPEVDIIVASPPCQAFSNQGNQDSLSDDRGLLLFQTFRIVEYQNPKVVIIENVPALLTIDSGAVFELISKTFELLNYKITYKLLNSINYNSVQSRSRLFIVAVDKDEDIKFVFQRKQKLSEKFNEIICDENDVDNVKYVAENFVKLFPIQKGKHLIKSHFRTDTNYEVDKVIYKPKACNTLLCRESSFFRIDGTIRTLTIKERWKLQSFTNESIDKFMELNLSRNNYLTITGNTINVNVLSKVIKQTIITFEKFQSKTFLTSIRTEGVVFNFISKLIENKQRTTNKRTIDTSLLLEQKQSLAAYDTHTKNKDRVKELIKATIETLIQLDKKINEYQVVKYSGLARMTVNKYFKDILDEAQNTHNK